MNRKEIRERFFNTMKEIAKQVNKNAKAIQEKNIEEFIELILQTSKKGHRVFVYGAGRSGFMGRAFAQRLMHLGISSCFISDTVTHQYKDDDLLIIISGSGETVSPVAIAKKAKKIGGCLALITANPQSTIGRLADMSITILGKSKDKAISEETLAPYTSLFDISTLALLDSIGGVLMKLLEVSEADIDARHATIE